MTRLLHQTAEYFSSKYGAAQEVALSQPEITHLLYRHDVAQLRTNVHDYLQYKDEVWLLFDNIDKGWATHGLQPQDLVIVKTLIEATRKIERELARRDISAHTIIFLRNDVYELLVDSTPDRGKETRANVDWSEPDMLRELIRKRVVFGYPDMEKLSFDELGQRICARITNGEESSQYLIERSLMRPRNLIDLLNHCRGYAVNLRHERITEEDVANGLKAYSTDLLRDINLEMRDVLPSAADAPYGFIGAPSQFSHDKLLQLMRDGGVKQEDDEAVYKILLWFAFIGVIDGSEEAKYIYSYSYDYKLLLAAIARSRLIPRLMTVKPLPPQSIE